MTAILIIVAAIILLLIGYVGYGSWLAKQWGIDPKKSTPAVEMEDGVDYVSKTSCPWSRSSDRSWYGI